MVRRSSLFAPPEKVPIHSESPTASKDITALSVNCGLVEVFIQLKCWLPFSLRFKPSSVPTQIVPSSVKAKAFTDAFDRDEFSGVNFLIEVLRALLRP